MKLEAVTIEGPRLRLEALDESHLAGLKLLAGEEEIWRYMSFVDLRDPQTLPAWRALVAQERARGEGMTYVYVDRTNGRVMGSTSLFEYSEVHRRAEIGRTWLGRPFWRTWVNTEAKYLLLRHAFESVGMNRVQLKTDKRNERSQRAIERLGAQREGILRAHMVMRDGYVRDTVMYSVTAPEWPAVRARLEGMMQRG